MATLDNYKNLALAQILTPPSPAASGTSMTLQTGQGAWLPVPPFDGTVFSAATFPTPANAEIVRVTAIAGDVATIQRGTPARAIQAGDYIAATFTEKFVTDMRDSSNQNAGLLADARLSSNIPRLNAANTFATDQRIQGATSARQIFVDPSQPANQRGFQIYIGGQVFAVTAVNDAIDTNLATPLTLDRNGNAKVGQDLYEKGRLTPLGHWTAIPYSGANFTPYPAGTWTVDSGDVGYLAYTVIGKTMTVAFTLYTTTVAGSPTELRIALPYTTAGGSTTIIQPIASLEDGGGWSQAYCTVSAAVGYLRLMKDPGAGTPWGPSTGSFGDVRVYGCVTFPIQ